MQKQTLRAVFKPGSFENGRQFDTPLSGCGSLIVTHKGELREAITVRTWYSPKGSGMQPVRAAIWIRPADSAEAWRSGRGSAGGCGYHKESQAIFDAVDSAGVNLYGKPGRYIFGDRVADLKARFYFGGTGSSGYEEIFSAIARAAGYRGRMLWVSHSL